VTDYKVDAVEQILPILEVVAREARPFVIVAEEIEGQALAALIMNAMRGTMKIAAVKAPRYGEERRNILKDLAISVGATFVSRESGIKMRDVKLENLGIAKSVEISKGETTIMGGKGTVMRLRRGLKRCGQRLSRLNQSTSVSEFKKELRASLVVLQLFVSVHLLKLR